MENGRNNGDSGNQKRMSPLTPPVDPRMLGKMMRFPLQGVRAPGVHILCENQLEEVWRQVQRYGTPEYCDRELGGVRPEDLDSLKQYIAARVLQAIEYRQSVKSATILTKPLLVYYSLLSLSRAWLAIENQKMCQPHHGLRVSSNTDRLGVLSAQLAKGGTLVELLSAKGAARSPDTISLLPLLQSIPELRSSMLVPDYTSDVDIVGVQAYRGGEVSLHFGSSVGEEDFKASWEARYPALAACCEYGDGCRLKLRAGTLPVDKDPNVFVRTVSRFCDGKFEVDLLDSSRWYIVSAENPFAAWPREARYMAALFMLAHTVRYQPELLYRESNANSYQHVLVDSVIRFADRYVPQLLLGWTDAKHFFSR